jgi:hypothetical protein
MTPSRLFSRLFSQLRQPSMGRWAVKGIPSGPYLPPPITEQSTARPYPPPLHPIHLSSPTDPVATSLDSLRQDVASPCELATLSLDLATGTCCLILVAVPASEQPSDPWSQLLGSPVHST